MKLNIYEARARRDKGVEIVTDNNLTWHQRAIRRLRKLRYKNRREFTGEEIRLYLEVLVGEPDHPNAWGALMLHACREELVEFAGRYEQPKDPKSHASKVQVWRFVR